MSRVQTGSCLCGGVRVTTRGPLREVVACHCTQCRKQTGHFYAATSVSDDRLTIEGEQSVRWYRSSETGRRGFCTTCGSALFWKEADTGTTSIMAGLFDQPTGLAIGRHIFCAHKGDYYEITDGRPQFAQSDR